MNSGALRRLLLAAYPATFRARYGGELALAVAEGPRGWRATADLARGALAAWLTPALGSASELRRSRLQSSVVVVFLAWCATACAAGGFSKAVDDQPVPGLRSWGWSAYATATVLFEISAAVVILFGLVYWLQLIVPALRARDRAVLRPALAPLPIVGAWLGVTALVAWYGRHNGFRSAHHLGAVGLAIFVAYLLVTGAAAIGCGIAAVRALDAAALPTRRLEPAVVIGAVAALAFTAQALAASVALVRVLEVGGIGLRGAAQAIPPVLVMLGSAAVALYYGQRGLRELAAAPAAA